MVDIPTESLLEFLQGLGEVVPELVESFQSSSHISPQAKHNPTDDKSNVLGKSAQNINLTLKSSKAVFLISPFQTDNISDMSKMERYAKRCYDDSIHHNESPILSYSFYQNLSGVSGTQTERDRALGLQVTWINKADTVVVYNDFGITPIMNALINQAKLKNKHVEYRIVGAHA